PNAPGNWAATRTGCGPASTWRRAARAPRWTGPRCSAPTRPARSPSGCTGRNGRTPRCRRTPGPRSSTAARRGSGPAPPADPPRPEKGSGPGSPRTPPTGAPPPNCRSAPCSTPATARATRCRAAPPPPRPGTTWACRTCCRRAAGSGEGGGERPPGVALDFTEPFHGGSCLHVRGLGPEAAEIDLYPARLDTAGLDGAAVELIHRGEGVRVELAAAWAEPGAPGEAPPYTHLTAPEGAEPVPGTPWKRSVFPLPAGEEGPLRALGVRLRAEEDGTEWRLGRLVVGRPGGPPPARPGRPRIEAAHTSEDGGTALRVRWNPAEG